MGKAEKKYRMETLFRALADRTRLRLLSLMGDTEVCVCFFVEILQTNQPKISRHLAYLRKAQVVGARREGKWMHYRIVEPPNVHAARIFKKCAPRLPKTPRCSATANGSPTSAAPRARPCVCRACPARAAPPDRDAAIVVSCESIAAFACRFGLL